MFLTRQQRTALKAVFDRERLWITKGDPTSSPSTYVYRPDLKYRRIHRITYREFRRMVRPYPGGGCIMVPWCGMWLGIETDGHTHS